MVWRRLDGGVVVEVEVEVVKGGGCLLIVEKAEQS